MRAVASLPKKDWHLMHMAELCWFSLNSIDSIITSIINALDVNIEIQLILSTVQQDKHEISLKISKKNLI